MLRRYLPHKEHGVLKKVAIWLLFIAVSLGILGIITIAGTIAILSISLPDVADIEKNSQAQSTEIFDREGNLLYTIHGEENREKVEFEDISPYLIDATVSIEDDLFWEHKGFDLLAFGRAGLYEVFGIGTPRGGSTITQQYIKNTFLSNERTYTRKLKELILAIRLERSLTKQEILALYLNRIPYGNNAYGVEKAAEIYFGKNSKELTLGESAILAALPQGPSRYNPFGNNKYSHLLKEFTEEELKKRTIEKESDLYIEEYTRGLIGQHVDLGNGETVYIQGRSDLVLKRMFDLETITMEERQEALNEIQTIEFNEYRESITHPHFVLYIKQILEERYGKDVVEEGGLKVTTTIDPNLQQYAEEIAIEHGAHNESSFGANNLAIFTINPKTGEILAMVGSRDYFDEEIDGNVNVVLRPRQPGSSFKPFTYAQAFYQGYAPGNILYDIPTKIGQDQPENYDGSWQGQISIRKALGNSRNIPAIKAYFLAGQQEPIIDLVERLGITSLNKSHSYGYPLALGAGEVSLFEMVKAYSAFATMGRSPKITGILKIENANGDVLEEFDPEAAIFPEVLDPQIAYLITNILSDKSNSVGPGLFVEGFTNAAKTGTSTKANKKESGGTEVRPSDAWTIGYSPSLITGVWVGNTDGSGLGYNANGYDAAAPIFKKIMTKAFSNFEEDEPFEEPDGIKHIRISKTSGLLPGPSTPESNIIEEVFASFSVPTEVENTFYTVKIDKISGKRATTFTPKDATESATYQNFKPIAPLLNWEQEIINYYSGKEESSTNGKVLIGIPPQDFDDIHTAETAASSPSITIQNPSSHTEIQQGSLTVNIELSAPNGVEVVEYYLDDKKEYFTSTAPYRGYLNISKFLQPGTRHLIVAKVIDKLGYSNQSAIEIKIVEED
ncbi:transglycosylase domain-containing protein [Patescibacteria group bacterium]|nr:transglycosylase domain-containing protein [Patescibacteria group bacterium]